jgi:hypothetical protein
VSSYKMTRGQIIGRRDALEASLDGFGTVLRGSLVERQTRHSKGCTKCARGEGHVLWVLTVTYPGGKNRQISVHPWQVPQVRAALDRYRSLRGTLEAISELNQELLVLDRQDSREVAA